ncbi:hypothetical protein Hdeb2414_s0005g00161811 [Helianthus debilis subsp. tardiflorus]
MVVPSHAVGKVMGASMEISESKSSRGYRVAMISRTPEQKRSAENLIQAFLTIALVMI